MSIVRAGAALLCACACAASLAGCDSSGGGKPAPSPDPLAALLDVPPPAGYTESATATGPLNLDAARVSTPVDPDQLAAELGRDGFDRGSARVWVSGGNFITFEVLRLHSAAGARSVVELVRSALSTAQGIVTADDPALPGSVVYTMFGSTRSGGKTVFCQGVWWPMARDVFGVTTCSPLPAGATVVEQLAEQQYQSAAGAEGVTPPATPSAAP